MPTAWCVPDPGASWWFDFATADAGLGGSVRLTVLPEQAGARRRAWYWACLVGDGRPLVAVRDDDVEPPRGASLEIHASGLWSALHCETVDAHWTVGLEAFAVSFDDPLDAWGDERGDLVPLGFDLEWEAEASGPARQPCMVTGEVLVGTETVHVDARGWRGLDPGPLAWPGWSRLTGHWDDGPAVASFVVGDDIEARPVHEAPVRLRDATGEEVRLSRSLCRLAGPGGRTGAGWWERVAG